MSSASAAEWTHRTGKETQTGDGKVQTKSLHTVAAVAHPQSYGVFVRVFSGVKAFTLTCRLEETLEIPWI